MAPFFTKIGCWRMIGLGLAPPPQVVLTVTSAPDERLGARASGHSSECERERDEVLVLHLG